MKILGYIILGLFLIWLTICAFSPIWVDKLNEWCKDNEKEGDEK